MKKHPAKNIPVKFEYVPHRRNIPDEELLADLRRVAQTLGVRTFTIATYKTQGQFCPINIIKRFGGWRAATTAARLQPSRRYDIPRDKILADIRRVARRLKTDHLSLSQYTAKGFVSRGPIVRLFGGWQNAVIAAGLRPGWYSPTSDQELFDNLKHVWQQLGRQPTVEDLVPPLSKFSRQVYARRFGGFGKALLAFVRSGPGAGTTPPPILLLRHKTSRWINLRLRFQIMQRDQFRCQACGRSPASEPAVKLQVDHIQPWNHGGETTINNLQTLCQACNVGKSDAT